MFDQLVAHSVQRFLERRLSRGRQSRRRAGRGQRSAGAQVLLEQLEIRALLSSLPTVTNVVNSQTNEATGSVAGSGNVQTITITGTGFKVNGASVVNNLLFGTEGVPATNYSVNSDTEITSTYPAIPKSSLTNGIDAVAVSVGVATGQSTTNFTFTYHAPEVTGLTPDHGPLAGGTPVTVSGKYLSGVSAVYFGTLGVASFTPVAGSADTTITTTSPTPPVPSPLAPIADAVTVLVNGLSSTADTSAGAKDLFTYDLAPTVTSLSVSTGPNAGGTKLTINGTNFGTAPTVEFGTTPVPATVNSDGTAITVTSPPGNGTVDVTVMTANGTSGLSGADEFRYSTIPMYITIPQDVAGKGVYMALFGTLGAAYGKLAAGTGVYLVSGKDGYEYLPLSGLTAPATVPPFLSTTTALSEYTVGLPNVPIDSGRVNIGVGAVTTVASVPSGKSVLPQLTINVGSTAAFPNIGAVEILTAGGISNLVMYNGTDATDFTGATGGSGTLAPGDTVRGPALLTTIVGNQSITSAGGALTVASTAGFPSSGTLTLATTTGNVQVVYTSTTATTFTLASGGAAVDLYTGNAVSGAPLPTPQTDGSGKTTGVAAPTPGTEGDNIYDFYEFTYKPDPVTGILKLTIDTSQVDQFGFPITLSLAGGSVAPDNPVGIVPTRATIMGPPNLDPAGFAAYVANTPFAELTTDGFGNPSTARIISPEDDLTINTVQNLTATGDTTAGTLPAGTYAYAVTAAVGMQQSKISQLAQVTLASKGQVTLIWGASRNQAVTGYDVYRGTVTSSGISWVLLPDSPTGATFTDSGGNGSSVSTIPFDPLGDYFTSALDTLFSTTGVSAYTASNPLVLTVTDGTNDGYQYVFNGVAGTEPTWVTTYSGKSEVDRSVLIFTCMSIGNYSPGQNPAPQIPTTSQFFVYQPDFTTNSLDPTNKPTPPAWNNAVFANYNYIPSAQVFAGNGVFADNGVEAAALFGAQGAGMEPANLTENAFSVALGAIEDDLDAALLRGIATTVNPVNWANAPSGLTAAQGTNGPAVASPTYYYVVTTVNANGESTASSEVSLQPTHGAVDLAWNPVLGATGYNVYRGTRPGEENELLTPVGGQSAVRFVDSVPQPGLPAGAPPAQGSMTVPTSVSAAPVAGGSLIVNQPYYYEVTALGVVGESKASAEVSATPTTGKLSVTLQWDTIPAASAYRVYRGTTAGGESLLVGTVPGQGAGTTVSFTDGGSSAQNPPPNAYYAPGSISDLYAEYFHQTSISTGGLSYADPFDDKGNQSSTLVASAPESINVSLGNWDNSVTTVTPSARSLSTTDQTLKIQGSGFASPASYNTVILSSGFGVVTDVNATGTEITVRFLTQPSLGALSAVVTTFNGNTSGIPVQVANVETGSLVPVVTILSGPGLSTVSTGADFTFSGLDAGAAAESFQYTVSLDGGAFQPTTAPSASFTNLSPGRHTLVVKAVDQDGRSSDGASYSWTVTTIAQIVIDAGANQSSPVGAPFAHPIVATVLDNLGNPVAGATVSFTIVPASGGASAVIQSAVSDQSGLVVVIPTANAIAGSYQVTATSGTAASAPFTLSNTAIPTPIIAIGAAPGAPPRVLVYNAGGSLVASFLAYAPRVRGGVRVAVADMNQDGVDDIITVSGPGSKSLVEVIDGTKLNLVRENGQIDPRALLASFYAYPARYTGEVFITTGDLNRDGTPDIIVNGDGSAGQSMKVINGAALLQSPIPNPIPAGSLPLLGNFVSATAHSKGRHRFGESHPLMRGHRHAVFGRLRSGGV